MLTNKIQFVSNDFDKRKRLEGKENNWRYLWKNTHAKTTIETTIEIPSMIIAVRHFFMKITNITTRWMSI